MNSIFLIITIITGSVFSQTLSVVKTINVSNSVVAEAYYAKFTSDDSKIIFSSNNYRGLYLHELDENTSSIISNENGAGYNPLVTDSNKIFFRTFELQNGRKFHSLNLFDARSRITTALERNQRNLKIPNQTSNNELTILVNSVPLKLTIDNRLEKNINHTAVYVESNNLIIDNGIENKILNPNGEGVYVWESISNDGKSILYTYSNRGSFVCDLEGNVILQIKDAHYPKFSPDGNYISYMIDKDDGYRYTESDIYIYSIREEVSYKITDTNNRIEMFAEWSNEGNKLIYHSTDGELFITTLRFDN